MRSVDEVFADDLRNPPAARSLPWEETRDGVTVVVEPRPHWSTDMRAFRRDTREYCAYADWTENGQRARFNGHIDTSGETVMAKAREIIAREIVGRGWPEAEKEGGQAGMGSGERGESAVRPCPSTSLETHRHDNRAHRIAARHPRFRGPPREFPAGPV